MITLWRFARPHTIIGTSLAVVVLYLVAASHHHASDPTALVLTWIASVAVNLSIVGLNQLTDVEIDRINKPELPLAAGTLSRRAALAIVVGAAVLALGVAATQGLILLTTIGLVLAIGTIYSVPPRLKRFPVLAAASIILARAVIGNLGVYLAFARALGGRAELPLHVLVFVGFLVALVAVIAIMKDATDIRGDREHGIMTFSVRLGARRVLGSCRVILTVAYVAMIGLGLAHVASLHPTIMVVGHLVGLAVVWRYGRKVDPERPATIAGYYRTIWRLFYFELVLFPLACVLGGRA